MKHYAIYFHPADHPEHWVVVTWDASKDPPVRDNDSVRLADTLEEAREHIPPGLHNVGSTYETDPVIYEVWI